MKVIFSLFIFSFFVSTSFASYSHVESYSSSINGKTTNQIYINTSSRVSKTEIRIPIGQTIKVSARLGNVPLVVNSQSNSAVAKVVGSGSSLNVKGIKLGTNTVKLCRPQTEVCKIYNIKVVDRIAQQNNLQNEIQKKILEIQNKIRFLN